MRSHLWSVVLLAALTSGCTSNDTTLTIYLEPDGTVTWEVLDRHVRSPSARPNLEREEAYLEAARVDRHPAALALRSLGATNWQTTILRSERPYTVVTRATFPATDQPIREFFRCTNGDTHVSLAYDGMLTRLVVTTESGDEMAGAACGDDFAEAWYAFNPHTVTFVATRGRFVDSKGFDLSSDRTQATLTDDADDDDQPPVFPIVQSLAWTTEW